MPGSKSATTVSSRHHRYDPGSDFSYKFVTRTFSRQGKRPATSPARIKHTALKKQPSPEDMIALAQSPSPTVVQESYGDSLLIIRRRTDKVRPGKFLQLQKLMNQPSPNPLISSNSTISTPRLVKNMIARAKTAESSRYSKQQSKETQYDYRSQTSMPSASTRTLFTGIQRSDTWETRDPQSSLSFSKLEDFSERCVRCSAFPDIQIEGHSLSRILTNSNVLMAKEHCEVLGAGSCPDCIRVRSQRQHEDHCSKNTPAAANDVYKIALVHERSPHLSKREVQRKLFDGDISDKVLSFPYWSQDISLPIANYEHQKEYEIENFPENRFLPDIHSKDERKHKSPSKPQTQNANTFETIYEASENENESEAEDRTLSVNSTIVESDKTKEMVFQKRSAEKLQKIQVVPAADMESATDLTLDNASYESQVTHKHENQQHSVSLKPVEKVEASNQTDIALPSSLSRKRIKQRYFTMNVVPSNNFFFDISDLAERLRNSGIIRTKAQSRNQTFQLIDVHQIPPTITTENFQDKTETESNASTDSRKLIKDFNMSYEPPVFSNYKGGYLGLSSATSRTSSVI